MKAEQNLLHAPFHLKALLIRLHNETDLNISQHLTEPKSNEWFAGWLIAGDVGPYPTAEDALVSGVGFLCQLIDQQNT